LNLLICHFAVGVEGWPVGVAGWPVGVAGWPVDGVRALYCIVTVIVCLLQKLGMLSSVFSYVCVICQYSLVDFH